MTSSATSLNLSAGVTGRCSAFSMIMTDLLSGQRRHAPLNNYWPRSCHLVLRPVPVPARHAQRGLVAPQVFRCINTACYGARGDVPPLSLRRALALRRSACGHQIEWLEIHDRQLRLKTFENTLPSLCKLALRIWKRSPLMHIYSPFYI